MAVSISATPVSSGLSSRTSAGRCRVGRISAANLLRTAAQSRTRQPSTHGRTVRRTIACAAASQQVATAPPGASNNILPLQQVLGSPSVEQFDFLVVGSGIAGLSYALKVGFIQGCFALLCTCRAGCQQVFERPR